MCLGIPMQVVSIDEAGQAGVAQTGGVSRPVRLDLVEDPKLGDFILVHAGYAIQKLSAEEAEETLSLLKEFIEAGEEGAELLETEKP